MLFRSAFTWSPTIRVAGAAPAPAKPALANSMAAKIADNNDGREWKASADFEVSTARASRQKPLDVWERFCQVLLLSNETMFID